VQDFEGSAAELFLLDPRFDFAEGVRAFNDVLVSSSGAMFRFVHAWLSKSDH
jgi:hypothetical protein